MGAWLRLIELVGGSMWDEVVSRKNQKNVKFFLYPTAFNP